MTARLALSGLSKCFGRHEVLHNVALEVDPGQIHAIVGHNGSGKSTVVKILAGYHGPEPGAVATVNGAPFPLGDAGAAYQLGLRFVHQDLSLIDTLDAVDNILLGSVYPQRRFGRIDWARARASATELLRDLGYGIDIRSPVGNLPLHERTGIALARALYQPEGQVSVLVLDETTAALPSVAVSHLFDVVRGLARRGLGIVYISHHLEEVFAIADRVTVLRDGHVTAVDDIRALDEKKLVELMVGVIQSGDVTRAPLPQHTVALQARRVSGRHFRDLDLDLCAGEIVGIAGLAGSGRDELAGALFGSTPRSGQVTIHGQQLPSSRPDRSISLGLGMLPVDRARNGLFMEMSVSDNLTLPLLPTHWWRCALDKRREQMDAEWWLQELQVRQVEPSRRMSELSGGSQQKVLLARWLRLNPRILILDEPTQGVDVAAVDHIYRLIRRAAAAGTSFLLCSSDTDELVDLCDRVLVLCRGAVRQEFSGSAITREAIDAASLIFSDGVAV